MLAIKHAFWAPYMPKLLLRRWGSLQLSPTPNWKRGGAPRRKSDRREGKRKEGNGWKGKGKGGKGKGRGGKGKGKEGKE